MSETSKTDAKRDDKTEARAEPRAAAPARAQRAEVVLNGPVKFQGKQYKAGDKVKATPAQQAELKARGCLK